MIEQSQAEKIKEEISEFFVKMTVDVSNIEIGFSVAKRGSKDETGQPQEERDVVDVSIKLDEPQILIGQGGQTLFEIQRLLNTVLNKKTQGHFYLNLDINDYKRQKVEYLKDFAKNLADQVVLNREDKHLLPMPSYERRIIHAELAERSDVVTESQGEGPERHIVIKPK